jgi:hypothetical protein
MSLSNAVAIPDMEAEGYPINFIFENTGYGTAYISVIDADRNDIRIDLGVPTNVGLGKSTNIKVWLRDTGRPTVLKMAYYYWDIDENCYRTELHIVTKHYDRRTEPDGYSELYFVKYQMVKRVKSKDAQMPKELYHWGICSRELFEQGWWEKK